MPHKKDLGSLLGGYLSALSNKLGIKKGFSLTELLIALAIVAVIAVLLIPVITTRAQNKSFAVSYDTEVKQMLNSLEGLPVNENKDSIENTMMFVEGDIEGYANNAGAYINKYMQVAKYCGDEPKDCFASMYYLYNADNERVDFPISGIKGACALLKNGVSICLKPQIKKGDGAVQEIHGWIDLNGPKEPNIYGRDLRTFTIDLKHQAAFTDEDPTKVIMVDPGPLCQGDKCGEPEEDPCKINPKSEECCKQPNYVARQDDIDPDPCCPWFKNETGANHDACYGPEPPCDPDTDPDCTDYCFHHTITGPGDECCPVLAAAGKPSPNCCTEDSNSDYCCSINPQTEKCCKKRIDSNQLTLTADNACCKYQSIYNSYPACKPACENDNNSEECCNSVERRNQINNPDDQCCRFGGVNGLLDAAAAGNSYNKYCCRLPKNNSEQCCKWKYNHINSSLDFYTKHDYEKNENVGDYDGCCKGTVRGIRYTEGKTDAKSQAVLDRCCTVNQAKDNADEDRLCCDYLVSKKGNSFLKHGQALRRCCKYNNHKNKPECCSHEKDGMASQTYASSVPYASQCCMPNSIYPNDVKPHVNCCFDVPNAQGEAGNIWKGNRWQGCCAYWNDSYKGHKVNNEDQWQLNCCYLKREKFPSGSAGLSGYNSHCCTNTSGHRDKWSVGDNECCDTLLEENASNNDGSWWKDHCCKGYLGGPYATTKEYYNTEAPCCYLQGNWTEACCTLQKIDKESAKWKKNCCDNPTLYGSNKNYVYRENCCESISKDYTRKDHGADNPKGTLNSKNVDLSKHKEYCCHYNATDPNTECCKLFRSKQQSEDAWEDWDGKKPDDTYKIKCCEKSQSATGDTNYCPNSCHIRWETSKTLNYDFARCCKDRALETNRSNVNRTTDVWQQNCCAHAPVAKAGNNEKAYASFEDYRKGCCKSNVDQTFKDGNDGSSQDNVNCCIPNKVTANYNGTTTFSGIVPTKACCQAFSENGWKDFDESVTLNMDYKVACCNKYNICDNSCEVRSRANIAANFDLPRCCNDNGPGGTDPNSDMQNRHKGDALWQQKCCDGNINTGKSTLNSLTDSDYRQYCCKNPGSQEATNMSGNEDKRCCVSVNGSQKLRSTKCCTNVPSSRTDRKNIGYHCDCTTAANIHNVVNVQYPDPDNISANPVCCTDSAVLTSADKSITKNATTLADWQSQCCSIENVHTKPASDTVRTRHYSYCCNNSGPYTDQSTWLNSTCCMTDKKTSASTSTEGVDWGSKNVSACCYYLPDYPTETCCRAASADWNNDVSTRDSGYKLACCNDTKLSKADNEYKYCSCGTKLDKDYPTTDTCCDKLKKTDNGKARWQADCCKYRTSYPNYTKYRVNCCSGDGVNNTTSNPSSNNNNKKYCCDPGAAKPTKACCQAFQGNIKDNVWYDWDGNAINANSNAYRKYCCQEHGVCDDCSIRSTTNNDKDQWNLPTCCFNSTMQSSHYKNETWRKACCSQSDALNNLGDSDYKTYCCTPKNTSGSANDTGAILGTTTLNQAQCCNTYTLGKTCCGSQGYAWDDKTKKDSCCDISKNGTYEAHCCTLANKDKGANTSWSNETFHLTCCTGDNKYCSCKMRLDKKLALNTKIEGNINCCENLKDSYYNNSTWQGDCCGKYTSSPSSVTDYYNNCCKKDKNGNIIGKGEVTGSSTKIKTCCDGKTIDDWCCDQGMNNQCSCTKRIEKGLPLDVTINKKNCCKETKASRTSTTAITNKLTQGAHWKSQCCKYTNPGGLTDAEFKSNGFSCCKNGNDGYILDNNQASICCSNSSSVISDFCCDSGKTNQCTCTKRRDSGNLLLDVDVTDEGNCCSVYAKTKGWYDNTYFQSKCCAKFIDSKSSYQSWAAYCCDDTKSSYKSKENWKNACCPSPSSNYSGYSSTDYPGACCKDSDGHYYGGSTTSQDSTCCSTSNLNSTFCCGVDDKYCSCDLQWNKNSKTFSSGCCDKLTSHASEADWQSKCCSLEGHVTGQVWLDNCCSLANINSAVGTDLAGCCAKLKSTSSLFSPGSTCCTALGVNESTGKSSVNGETYSGCIAICNLTSTYGNGSVPYAETKNAKSCCGSGPDSSDKKGLANSSWYQYCCGMRKTSDAWTYSGSSYYSAPNSKCCAYRKSGQVYTYVPSYKADSSKKCPGGGEKNKCASFLDTSLGFYCGSEDSCTTWSKNQNADVPSTNLDACCERLYNKGLISSSTNATDNNANYYQEAKNKHYKACCRDAAFRGTTKGTKVCCTSEPPEDMHDVGKACCALTPNTCYCKLSFRCVGTSNGVKVNNLYNTHVSCSVSGCARNYAFQIGTLEIESDGSLKPHARWLTGYKGAFIDYVQHSNGSLDYDDIIRRDESNQAFSFDFSNIGAYGYPIEEWEKIRAIRGCFVYKYNGNGRLNSESYPYDSGVGNRAGWGDYATCYFKVGDKTTMTNCCGIKDGTNTCCEYTNYVPEEYK